MKRLAGLAIPGSSVCAPPACSFVWQEPLVCASRTWGLQRRSATVSITTATEQLMRDAACWASLVPACRSAQAETVSTQSAVTRAVISKKERQIFVGALIILITSGITYGLLSAENYTHRVAAEGGEFKEGVVGQPIFINPVIPTTQVDRDIAKIVFSSVAEVADSIKS